MSEWTEDEKWLFDECLRRAVDEAPEADARGGFVEGGPEHTVKSDPDPGSTSRTVETPGGEAEVIREEEDGQLLVWMSPHKLNVKLPADLVRPVT